MGQANEEKRRKVEMSIMFVKNEAGANLQQLMEYAAKGYTRLGVDFESLNPTAYGFWLKYFDAYTHSVVRRIDEKAVTSI